MNNQGEGRQIYQGGEPMEVGKVRGIVDSRAGLDEIMRIVGADLCCQRRTDPGSPKNSHYWI